MAHSRKPDAAPEASRDSARAISPLAEIVARSLRQDVLAGVLPAGRPLPSERSLAGRYSVSRTVIREAVRTLSSDGLLLQADRCRPVLARAETRKPRQGALRIGVWLWPQADDTSASSIFRGIQRAVRGHEARLIVGSASHESWDDDVAAEARFVRQLTDDEAADGAILWYLGGAKNLPVLRDARAKGLQLAFVDRQPPAGFDADFVGTENVTSARNAVAHLIGLGHRRIAFVSNLDTASPVREREEGYRRALDDAGIEPDERLRLRFGPGADEADDACARRTARDLLALDPRPSAVFTVNDSVGLILIEALRESGARVPGDLSVVGFDGLLHWVPGGGPLTTAKQNFTTIGELAGEALLRRLASDSPSTYRHVLLDAPLSHGGSTAAFRAEPGPSSSPRRESIL